MRKNPTSSFKGQPKGKHDPLRSDNIRHMLIFNGSSLAQWSKPPLMLYQDVYSSLGLTSSAFSISDKLPHPSSRKCYACNRGLRRSYKAKEIMVKRTITYNNGVQANWVHITLKVERRLEAAQSHPSAIRRIVMILAYSAAWSLVLKQTISQLVCDAPPSWANPCSAGPWF